MGNAVNAGADNEELTDNLCEADYIRTARIERVFRAVDRGEYILPEHRVNAYRDQAWRSNHLHLSAPCIYSEVLEGLSIMPGMSFLNLGSGTGYLSTLVGLILGHQGINHGVEFYEDVIQYANKKLEDFKRYSGAMDEFDFCEPKFMQGNCLCLTSDRRYDRVYVGAACPAPFDTYLKNLVKVGGILVMPFHDQLLQVRRESETGWTASSLLPVSFAMLLLPKEDNKDSFELMDLQPDSLEKLCRTKIRNILRENVECEHPELCRPAERQVKTPRPRTKAGKRHLCHNMEDIFMRCATVDQEAQIIPDPSELIRDFIYNSDSSSLTEEGDNDNDSDGDNDNERGNIDNVTNSDRPQAEMEVEAQCGNQNSEMFQRIVNSSTASRENELTNFSNEMAEGLTRALSCVPGVSVSPIVLNESDDVEQQQSQGQSNQNENQGTVESATDENQQQVQQRLKCRKFDSGLGDDESTDDEASNESGQTYTKRTKLGWFNQFLNRRPVVKHVNNQNGGGSTSTSNTSNEIPVETEAEQPQQQQQSNLEFATNFLRMEEHLNRQVNEEEDDYLTTNDDSDEYPEESQEDMERYHKRRTVDSPFTDLMNNKINELPLPQTLKSFLNFYRF